jgi:outer membrane lipoprotein-sorting protein
MHFLRTISTRRLIALIAGVVVAGAGGTAIALAARGNGPVPGPKPLATAVHDALAAPSVKGITARVQFTNHLIDASSLQGSDPILNGGSGRLWLSGDGHMRLEVQGDNGDAQLVSDGKSFWVYDPSSTTVYRGSVPAGGHDAADTSEGPPTLADVQAELGKLARYANLSGARPGDVANQPAYTVTASPQHDGGLLGSAELAWDAIRGVPLRFAVYARGNSTPVLELRVSDISYGSVPASDLAIAPPAHAKVVKIDVPAGGHAMGGRPRAITGVSAVAKRLTFSLSAPGTLVGLPRRDVRLLDWEGKPAALALYGRNLGGIAVLEQPAGSAGQIGGSGRHANLSLPTVSIGGATGQELDTALGTLIRFQRAGVAYTVLGSVPPAAAEAAARGL